MTAIRSSGISIYRFLYPVAAFSLGAALLTALVSIWMLPRGKTALEALTYKTITSSPAMGLKEQEFISSFSNLTIYISELDKKTNALSGYFTVDPDTGIFRLNLLNGLINQVRPDKKTFQSICFKRYAVNLDLQKPIPKKYRQNQFIF